MLRNRRINRHQLRSGSTVFQTTSDGSSGLDALLGAPGIIAIGMAAWCASTVFIGSIWSWFARENILQAAAVCFCVLTAPLALQVFGLADARILALPMTFGAATLLREKRFI